MIIDKLYTKVQENGNVCVGLDTDLSYIPASFRDRFENDEDAVFEFNKAIIDATCDVAACYKPQIAYYEAMGIAGLKAYSRTLKYIKSVGSISVGDIKRGDISKTGEMYAQAHFSGDFEADFITLSPYMGFDSIEPYIDYLKNKDKGVFVLVRTSNSGSKDIQHIEDKNGKKVFELVGSSLNEMGKEVMGECGYSSIGAVIGCTSGNDCEKAREQFENTFFLIPGYGAQGGKAEDVVKCLRNGNGGVVNSSRGIMLAYRKHEDGEERFAHYAREEVLRIKKEIEEAAGVSL